MAKHLTVDRNVQATRNVLIICHALTTNAKIHAKALVLLTQNVELLVTLLSVCVHTVLLEILSPRVLKNGYKLKLSRRRAHHLLVELTLFVKKEITLDHVPV